jgi:hypothetical protein
MFGSLRARAWLLAIPFALILFSASCGGGGSDQFNRDPSSILTVTVDTGNGNGTIVDLNSDVQLDKCILVLVNGASQQYSLNDAYVGNCSWNSNVRLKYAKVLSKNGNDYWYFDRSGTYLSQGANDPKVAVPGDY